MKLIIDISEEDYKFIKEVQLYLSVRRSGKTIERNVINAIKNGTPYEDRPKGNWVGDTDYESYQGYYEAYKCSICGYELHWRDYSKEYNFCPKCGAIMLEEVAKGLENDQ